MSSLIDDYEEAQLKTYMEDRVLAAIKKIPFEEQYFLIIVLFLKFLFCYGVENTTFVIIFILNWLKSTTNSTNNYYYNLILDGLKWLNENLQLLVDKYVNTKPDATEIERYKAFEDYLLLLEAKLYVLLANLTCCHSEIFGKQYLKKVDTPIIKGTNVIVKYGNYKLKGTVDQVNGDGTYQINYNMDFTVNPDIKTMNQVGENVDKVEKNVDKERVELNQDYEKKTTYEFDEKKLKELFSRDIPFEMMDQLKEKYECTNKEECIDKMIKDINSTPEVVKALKMIVDKQDLQRKNNNKYVKIKDEIKYYLRNKPEPITLQFGRNVQLLNKSTEYDCVVYAENEWNIGYKDKNYNIHPTTGAKLNPNELDNQKYNYYHKGFDKYVFIENKDVNDKVKPMKCYQVIIEESEFPIVLPESAFDLTDIERYVENPVIKNAFEDIKQVIHNVFTNQDESDKYLENYLNGVAEKEYRTKERFFQMVGHIFGTQHNEIQLLTEAEEEEPINPYALDTVAPPILHGCVVGIRYARDSMIYLLGRFVDNVPAFRDWLLRNWNNIIDRMNELLVRINQPDVNDRENPPQENRVAVIPPIIPPITPREVGLILEQPPTRPNTPQFGERIPTPGRPNTPPQFDEARTFVDDMNARGSQRQRDRVYNQQNNIPQPIDLYQELGIPRTASQQEIKTAYRTMARQWHPDKNSSEGATAKFQKISQAYVVLSDPVKRRLYDYDGTIGGKTIKHRKGRRKGTKYIKTNKKYKKKLPRKTIKKHQKKSSRKRKTRRKN